MSSRTPIIPKETFRFFRDLAKNNRKVWMDANRERYQASGSVGQPSCLVHAPFSVVYQ